MADVQKCDIRFSSVTVDSAHGEIAVTYPNEYGLLDCSPHTKTVVAHDINRDGVLDAFVETSPSTYGLSFKTALWIPEMIEGIGNFIAKYEGVSGTGFTEKEVACTLELQNKYSMVSARLFVARDKFIEQENAALSPYHWPSSSLYVKGQQVLYDVRYNHGASPAADLSSVTIEGSDTHDSIEIPINDFPTVLRTAIVDGERDRSKYKKKDAEKANSQKEGGVFVTIANWFR